MAKEKHKFKFSVSKLVCTIVLGILALTMIFPLLWMLSTSFKIELEVFNFPIEWITAHFNFDNYKEVLGEQYNFLLYFKNTIVITAFVVILQLVITSMGAYAFAKMDFAFKGGLFALFLATMMIPDQVTIVPRFLMMSKLHLYNTHTGLVLMMAFSVYGVFLMRQAMIAVPDTVVEAAKIDGASHARDRKSVV